MPRKGIARCKCGRSRWTVIVERYSSSVIRCQSCGRETITTSRARFDLRRKQEAPCRES